MVRLSNLSVYDPNALISMTMTTNDEQSIRPDVVGQQCSIVSRRNADLILSAMDRQKLMIFMMRQIFIDFNDVITYSFFLHSRHPIGM